MNMHLREGRNYVRQFVEVPGGFRRTVEEAIEGLIAVLDQIDADPDLEDDDSDEPTLGWPETTIGPHGIAKLDKSIVQDDGELEPTCGWSRTEAELGCGYQHVDEGEEDDPGEDNGDYEHDTTDENLTTPDTSGGLVIVANDNESMALRECFDPRLALRPSHDDLRTCGWRFAIPRFPHEPANHPRFYADDELRRLGAQVMRLRTRRKRAR